MADEVTLAVGCRTRYGARNVDYLVYLTDRGMQGRAGGVHRVDRSSTPELNAACEKSIRVHGDLQPGQARVTPAFELEDVLRANHLVHVYNLQGSYEHLRAVASAAADAAWRHSRADALSHVTIEMVLMSKGDSALSDVGRATSEIVGGVRDSVQRNEMSGVDVFFCDLSVEVKSLFERAISSSSSSSVDRSPRVGVEVLRSERTEESSTKTRCSELLQGDAVRVRRDDDDDRVVAGAPSASRMFGSLDFGSRASAGESERASASRMFGSLDFGSRASAVESERASAGESERASAGESERASAVESERLSASTVFGLSMGANGLVSRSQTVRAPPPRPPRAPYMASQLPPRSMSAPDYMTSKRGLEGGAYRYRRTIAHGVRRR